MSFGHGLRPTEIIEATELCEKSGFDHVWISESVSIDALAVLGGIASRTSKIRLGSGVVNVYTRSAVQLAMAAATLDELSHGRFELGIGAGSRGVVKEWHQVEYKNQLQQVRKTTEAIRKKLGGVPGGLNLLLNSSETRKIPIILAAVGDRMVLLAKEKADGVLFFLRPRSRLVKDARTLSSEHFKICANVVSCVSSQIETAQKGARRTIAFYLTYGKSYRRFIESECSSLISNEVLDSISSAWKKGKREESAVLIPKELLDEIAICGTPSECRRILEEEYLDIKGVSLLSLQFNAGEGDLGESLRLVQSLSKAK